MSGVVCSLPGAGGIERHPSVPDPCDKDVARTGIPRFSTFLIRLFW